MVQLGHPATPDRWQPGRHRAPSRLLADGEPKVSEDGKTITVTHQDEHEVRAPPVEPRGRPPPTSSTRSSARSARRRRTATPDRTSPHRRLREAVKAAQDDPTGGAPDISGHHDAGRQTLVFKLTSTSVDGVAGALSLPISVPVPEEYAEKYDAETPSTTARTARLHGPVHGRERRRGQAHGYARARRSSWSATRTGTADADFRPAYLDAITIQEGNDDTDVGRARRSSPASASGQRRLRPPPSVTQAGARPTADGPADRARRAAVAATSR